MGEAPLEGGVVRGRLLKRYDRVVAISDHMRRRMLDLGIPDDRITTVHLGLDAPAYRKRVHRSPAEVRAEFGVPGDRVLAVMVGNVRRWKGQHVILAGLAEMAPAVRNRLRVLFVGAAAPSDAGYEAGLRQTVRERGLEDVVRFVGGRQDVPDLVNAADICLHASVIPEPFGLVVLEAMALSRPLIAAASGGPAEILTPDSGILFDTEQPAQLAGALTRLVEDAELRERMGKAAARRVEEFSLLRNLRGNVQVYREVLGLA
jgi:glycosyltransferase involved in cell wall biosynthesis